MGLFLFLEDKLIKIILLNLFQYFIVQEPSQLDFKVKDLEVLVLPMDFEFLHLLPNVLYHQDLKTRVRKLLPEELVFIITWQHTLSN